MQSLRQLRQHYHYSITSSGVKRTVVVVVVVVVAVAGAVVCYCCWWCCLLLLVVVALVVALVALVAVVVVVVVVCCCCCWRVSDNAHTNVFYLNTRQRNNWNKELEPNGVKQERSNPALKGQDKRVDQSHDRPSHFSHDALWLDSTLV